MKVEPSNRVYEVGTARRDITPPIGIRLIGYAVREGLSHGTDEPLTLTALAIRSGKETVVLISADLCIVYVSFAKQFRDHCAKSIGIPSSHILFNFSHTHSSPATDGYLDYDTPDQLELQSRYRKQLLEAGAECCQEAINKLQLARFSIGWGTCYANINRRQATDDNEVLLGENQSGVCDDTVGVLRADDLNGSPIAIVFRYSCHTVALGPKTNVFSPDFIGPARRLIEGTLKCHSLFLQGCAGNINPVTGIGQLSDGEPRFKEDTNRLGEMLGSEVIKIAQSLYSNRRRKEPVLVKSVAWYWLYEYENIAPGEPGHIEVNEIELDLPLSPFPVLSEVENERASWAEKLRSAELGAEREWVLGPLQCYDAWAERRLKAAKQGPNPHRIKFPIQTIRFDGFQIVGLPFEPMAETGLALRAALGENTFVLGYTNGMVSYLPTPQISAEGGMEAKSGYQAYLVPSEVPGDWEPKIRDKVAAMLPA